MRIVVARTCTPFVFGGAEILAEELVNALQAAGHLVDTISIPFTDHSPEKLLDNMLACRLLEVIRPGKKDLDRLIALNFPAYLIPHPNKVIWLIHQYRAAYDLWDTPLSNLQYASNSLQIRAAVYRADQNAFLESQQIYTISQKVSQRLSIFNHLDCPHLYHPPRNADQFYCDLPGDYIFFPSRITPIKRQELIIQALSWTKQPVKVLFAGTADVDDYMKTLEILAEKLQVSDRAIFLGKISESEKIQYYAQCRGVVYPPVDEDYGYVTLEAMLSAKPIITCDDSGEPLEFVCSGETGWVVEATPQALADAMDKLWANAHQAAQMGQQAREKYKSLNIDWSTIVEKLLK
ncbi:glycosyltransferase family 4 protein [Nostoc sp. LEGE 06077]|uniref:glycosyltransferase family 4 protein n=1 Tax=Nostoc sp. LEGE 06077 TaxID=915325 RepID=UPI0018804787|nr:glycosyltransferase family 4 protein [Nostoc sp. LEGE 06077]MBE9210926.1 glycosyltransferase family 4 protein [Nostoc sp. LEGE 06077]